MQREAQETRSPFPNLWADPMCVWEAYGGVLREGSERLLSLWNRQLLELQATGRALAEVQLEWTRRISSNLCATWKPGLAALAPAAARGEPARAPGSGMSRPLRELHEEREEPSSEWKSPVSCAEGEPAPPALRGERAAAEYPPPSVAFPEQAEALGELEAREPEGSLPEGPSGVSSPEASLSGEQAKRKARLKPTRKRGR